MTYRYEIQRLARAVSNLLVRGGQVPPQDIAAALAGHTALVSLITTVQDDIAARTMPPEDSAQALEERPIAVLRHTMGQQPRRLDTPITDVMLTNPSGRPGRQWREIAAAATVAEHDWRTGFSPARVEPGRAWAEIADMASLARAVAVLDGDLADSLAEAGRTQDAAVYRAAGRTGLGIAARESLSMATSGPLPHPVDINVASVEATQVLRVKRESDIPAGLLRLRHLLSTSAELSPAQLAVSCRTLARASLLAGASLSRAGDDATAAWLRQCADQLAHAASQSRWVTSIDPGNVLALAQAQEVYLQLTRLKDLSLLPTPDLARGIAHGVDAASSTLPQVVDRLLAKEHWLVRREDTALEWGPVRARWETPAVRTTLANLPRPPVNAIAAGDRGVRSARSAYSILTQAIERAKPRASRPGRSDFGRPR